MLFIIYWLFVHIILKLVICFAFCVLKMFTVWLGLRFEMPIFMTIHNVVHHHLLTSYFILKRVICIAVHVLRICLHWLSLCHHQVCLMVINVWLEHSASFVIYLHRPTENVVCIFLNNVTQRQSMYEACSVSKVPTSIIFFNNPFILWW
jgi:hypothetical protein